MKKIYISVLFSLSFIFTFAQEVLWEKTIGGDKSDYLYDIQPTPDFGFILAGSSLSDESGNKKSKKQGDLDYFLWKMDEKGNQVWQKTFGGAESDYLYSVGLTSEGGYILGGSSNSPKSGDKRDGNFGLTDFWVIKLDPEGNEEWQFILGGKGEDILLSIEQTKDKGYILGGTSDSDKGESIEEDPYQKNENSRGSMDFWVIKISESGELEWQKTIGGKYYDLLRSIHQTYDMGYILGGYSNSPASGEKSEDNLGVGDFWIVKLNEKGEIEWDKTIGGDGNDELFTLIPTLNKTFLCGGNSNSNISGKKDVRNINGSDWWVLELDEFGEIIWQKNYDIGEHDILVNMIETDNKEYLLSGYAKAEKFGDTEDKGIEDYVAIKIDLTGNELWRKSIGGNGSDYLQGTIKSRDGGYILAGTSASSNSRDKNAKNLGREDFWIVKLLDANETSQIAIDNMEIYPNPAKTYVNIILHVDFQEADLQIFDMLGSLVLQKKLNQKTTPVDIRQLQTGGYVIKVITENNIYTKKLLKK